MIEEVRDLLFFLEQEQQTLQNSRLQWEQELKLFADLAHLYIKLKTITKLSTKHRHLLASVDLFLCAESSMYSAVSHLLRRRLGDAESVTRRAIEETATAYRLFKHPNLLEVYRDAYPISKDSSSSDWRPSEQYRQAFASGKLFSEPPEFWSELKIDYAMFSVMAVHAGLGTITKLVTTDTMRTMPLFEPDDKNIYRTWYHFCSIYSSLLKVFVHILRGAGNNDMIRLLEDEIVSWHNRASALLEKRAPWIAESTKARWAEQGKNRFE